MRKIRQWSQFSKLSESAFKRHFLTKQNLMNLYFSDANIRKESSPTRVLWMKSTMRHASRVLKTWVSRIEKCMYVNAKQINNWRKNIAYILQQWICIQSDMRYVDNALRCNVDVVLLVKCVKVFGRIKCVRARGQKHAAKQ